MFRGWNCLSVEPLSASKHCSPNPGVILRHFEVGRKVRQTIKDLGGTMPEDLPTPEKSIQQLQQEEAKRLQQKLQPELPFEQTD